MYSWTGNLTCLTDMTQIDLGWRNVDQITIGGDPGRLIIDDIALQTSVTPEPGTLILVGTGIAGLLGARRRRRAKRAEGPPADALR